MTIQIKNISKNYSGDLILDNLSLDIKEHTISAITGENGSGKSTLLKCIAQIENYQAGNIQYPKDTKITYLDQIPPSFDGTLSDYLLESFTDLHKLQKKMEVLENEMTSNIENLDTILVQYGKVQETFQRDGGYDLEYKIDFITQGLGINHLLNSNFNLLSGGEKTRSGLALALLQEPNLLLLDEPTNHLDIASTGWLINYLKSSKATILMVSHDRYFLNQTVSLIHNLDYGQLDTYYGNYDYFKVEREARFNRLMEDYDLQQREIKRVKLQIRRYRQWGHEADNADMFKKAKELEKRLEKMENINKPSLLKNRFNFKLDNNTQSGKMLIEADGVSIQFGNRTILANISLTINREQKIALLGHNGSGKSTLIKTLMSVIKPDSGTIRYGEQTRIAYLPQEIEFKTDKNILDYYSYERGISQESARQSLHNFGFTKDHMFKTLDLLSGGEKVRLKLALLMYQNPNLLIFDEPTNHLDINSLEIIEEVLKSYKGAVLLISHDRYLMESVCNIKMELKDGTLSTY